MADLQSITILQPKIDLLACSVRHRKTIKHQIILSVILLPKDYAVYISTAEKHDFFFLTSLLKVVIKPLSLKEFLITNFILLYKH